MALRAGYKGFKKLIAPLILNRPGTIAIDQDALNAELNKTFFPRSEQTMLGAKNLLPNKAITQTVGGVSYTVNSDGSVSCADTSTATSWLQIWRGKLKRGTYIVSGCPSGGGTTGATYRLGFWNETPSAGSLVDIREIGNGATVTITDDTQDYAVYVGCGNGTDMNGITFKPMLRLATDPDSDFASYAMTNKELTDDVETLNGSASEQKTAINAIITAATGAADFAAFQTAMGAITPVTRSIQVTPETREEITEPEEEPEVKKTTRKKSTANADTVKEGE